MEHPSTFWGLMIREPPILTISPVHQKSQKTFISLKNSLISALYIANLRYFSPSSSSQVSMDTRIDITPDIAPDIAPDIQPVIH
ncbi:MAG: hypothetical protein ACAF42_17035 [Limnothrix sp. BL-A-16]|jgi:hypothetical protein